MFHVERDTPTPADAKAQRLVRLPDGRTGRLLWCPSPRRRLAEPGGGKGATMARVQVHGRHYRVPATELRVLGCPDGGTCHHSCSEGTCYLVGCCGPLSGVFPGDDWPPEVVVACG